MSGAADVWFVARGPDGESVVRDENGLAVAYLGDRRDDAAQIVKEHNAHAALVAALRTVHNCLPDENGGTTLGSYEMEIVRVALSQVQV